MPGPISPPSCSGTRGGALPAYVSNGLVGLRVREIPLVAGSAIVSGVAGEHCERRIEAAAPVPYPLAGDIAIDGVRLSDEPWAAHDLAQSYDFATGELTSRFAFGAGDRRATVEILTFASRSHAPLVLQEVALTVDAPCRIELVAAVDPKAARGIIRERRTGTPAEKSAVCDGSLHWESDGALS